jgi:hypothetical protein
MSALRNPARIAASVLTTSTDAAFFVKTEAVAIGPLFVDCGLENVATKAFFLMLCTSGGHLPAGT